MRLVHTVVPLTGVMLRASEESERIVASDRSADSCDGRKRNGRCMIAQNRGVKTELLVLKPGEGKGEDWKWREWEGKK